jgi:glutathione peroxidase
MNTLKHVRPGDGYVPKFQVMAKSVVNGEGEEPLWTYLKSALPASSDYRAGMIFNQTLCRFSGPPSVEQTYTWNFEKFLINQDGKSVKRYSPKHENQDVSADIDALLNDPNASP